MEVGDASTFKLRVGPNYKKHGKKEPSASQMYRLIAMDTYRVTRPMHPAAPLFDMSHLGSPETAGFTHPTVPRFFVMNCTLPDFAPSVLGGKKDAGPWLQMTLFFEITPEAIEMVNNQDDPAKCDAAHRLYATWCKEAETDQKMRTRLKFAVFVHNYDEIGLPGMLSGYNAKPMLVTSSGTFFRGPDNRYIEMTMNVGIFGFVGRKGLHTLKQRIPELDVTFMLCIEARSDEEMPERCVVAGRVRGLEGYTSPFVLSDDAIAFLRKAAAARDGN